MTSPEADAALSDDHYYTKLERKKVILNFMENGDWQSVLDRYDKSDKYREPLLVWIRPSLDCLQFIEKCLIDNLGIEKVYVRSLFFKFSYRTVGFVQKL